MKKWNLTDEERKSLIRMAAGQKPWNASYYAKALDEIEQGKVGPWNWASALLGHIWLAYHKAFVLQWTLFICTIFITLFIKSTILSFLSDTLFITLYGLFGNRLLFVSLRKKQANRYADLPHYAWTESRWIWISLALISVGLIMRFFFDVVCRSEEVQPLIVTWIGVVPSFSFIGILTYKTIIRPIIDSQIVRKIREAHEQKKDEQ